MAAARALLDAYRVLCRLGATLRRHEDGSDRVMSQAGQRFVAETWQPATQAAGRAETAFVEVLRDQGVAGVVVGGRLYIDLLACRLFNKLTDHHCANVLIVDLADIPDLAR